MTQELNTYFETRLQREIEQIDLKIKELTEEKYALQRQLIKARRDISNLEDVNRKNSAARVMIERKVVEALTASGGPMHLSKLYGEAKVVDFKLKENTFRTHIHRFSQKGIIVPAGKPGMWKIAPKKQG